MRLKLRTLTIFIFFILITGTMVHAEPDFDKILGDLDSFGNFDNSDFSCVWTIVSEKPGEENSIIKARMFRRDTEDKFLLLILKPEIQKGQGYLQYDDNVWFYDPESRKFSHASIRENIQGSDAKNSDVNRNSLSEDYRVTEWEESTLGKYPVYVIELEAVHNEVSYPGVKLWVQKDVTLVLKEEAYSLSGRLMRTTYYPNYKKLGDKYIPSKMLMVDELKEGEKTQMTIADPSISELPDSVFTKAFLEKVSN
jgi:hypothetical protein